MILHSISAFSFCLRKALLCCLNCSIVLVTAMMIDIVNIVDQKQGLSVLFIHIQPTYTYRSDISFFSSTHFLSRCFSN